MFPFSNELYSICPRIIIYAEKNCLDANKIMMGLSLIESEYKCYYLNEHFTMEQFKQTFGEDAQLPKIIYNKNDAV